MTSEPDIKPDGGPPDELDTKPEGDPDSESPDEPDGESPEVPDPETPGAAETESPDEPDAEAATEPDVEPAEEKVAGEENGDPGPQSEPAPWVDTPPEKIPDLGPPLVDDQQGLRMLDKPRPVWIDAKNKRIVMVGQICQTEAPLELFACLRDTKEHEAIVTVGVQAATVHAGLILLGAKPGHPARWDPAYQPAAGTEIEITVVFKDKQGKRRTARAQDWVRDARTDQAMTHPWVFAGSGFWKDEETNKEYYQAEGGDFICVSNFTTAMLDLPIESSQVNDALMFHAFTERIPPRGTPVTLILTPKLDTATKQGEKPATADGSQPTEADAQQPTTERAE